MLLNSDFRKSLFSKCVRGKGGGRDSWISIDYLNGGGVGWSLGDSEISIGGGFSLVTMIGGHLFG
jgi:hypothetical protein